MNNLKVDYDTYIAEIESILSEIKDTFLSKGKEYVRNNDPFHNFNKSATRRGITPEEVLLGFVEKHFVSIDDLVGDISEGKEVPHPVVKEKTNDIIIYMMILQAMSFVRNNPGKRTFILTEDQVVKLRSGKTSRRGGKEYPIVSPTEQTQDCLTPNLRHIIQERIHYYEKKIEAHQNEIEEKQMGDDFRYLHSSVIENMNNKISALECVLEEFYPI